MFYYVIYNSTVLNYSNNNKKLNTFIYGTVLYILSHGLINSYDNQFAKYIKSYFWVILAIDIFSIYYLHNFIDNNNENETETETDKNSLKSLLETFYNKQDKKDKKDHPPIQEKITNEEENVNLEINKKENTSEHVEVNNEEPQPYFPEDLDINEKIKNHTDDNTFDENNNNNNNNNNNENFDQMSEAGSDFDLDKFEESLQ